MSNGKEFLNDFELEQYIKSAGDRELLEFTARQVYDVCNVAADNKERIGKLEGRNKRLAGTIGGLGTLAGAIVVGVVDYFVRRAGG